MKKGEKKRKKLLFPMKKNKRLQERRKLKQRRMKVMNIIRRSSLRKHLNSIRLLLILNLMKSLTTQTRQLLIMS